MHKKKLVRNTWQGSLSISYHHRKLNWWQKFKSWTKLFGFHCVNTFGEKHESNTSFSSHQLWVISREDWVQIKIDRSLEISDQCGTIYAFWVFEFYKQKNCRFSEIIYLAHFCLLQVRVNGGEIQWRHT